MKKGQYFKAFSEEKQQHYEQEIRQRYGDKAFEGVTDWNSYTPEQKAAIQVESQAAQPILARWHQHLRCFYEPSVERLRGLGQLYCMHPDFRTTFTGFHPALPEFMKLAIELYCDKL